MRSEGATYDVTIPTVPSGTTASKERPEVTRTPVPRSVGGRWLSLALGTVQAFVALGAIPAGLAMVVDPTGAYLGLSPEILSRSPFADFYVPGVLLLSINGIGTLLGAIPTFLRRWPAGEMAVALGTFLTLWMVAQILWLGLVSPLQPLLVWAGLAEMGMGLALRQVLPSRRG